jgi:thiol-disulfide isomerase/thioredoxin
MTFNVNKRAAMYAGVAALAALAGIGVAWKRGDVDAFSAEAMQALWATEFDTPNGELLRMSDFQGRPLVINFWATWCTPCIEEMPLIDAFYRQNKSSDWQVVGLAIDQPSRVRQFLHQFPVAYPVALAGMTGTELGRQLGNDVGGLPFTVVLDGHARLIHRKVGKLNEVEIRNWAA